MSVVVVVGMFFQVVLSVIQRVKVSQYVLFDMIDNYDIIDLVYSYLDRSPSLIQMLSNDGWYNGLH